MVVVKSEKIRTKAEVINLLYSRNFSRRSEPTPRSITGNVGPECRNFNPPRLVKGLVNFYLGHIKCTRERKDGTKVAQHHDEEGEVGTTFGNENSGYGARRAEQVSVKHASMLE